jgi:hypothetical protein
MAEAAAQVVIVETAAQVVTDKALAALRAAEVGPEVGPELQTLRFIWAQEVAV